MNERIIKLGLDSGMLNYVDHETPRHYFLCGNADEECLEKFAELIVRQTLDAMAIQMAVFGDEQSNNPAWYRSNQAVLEHFGIEQ